MHTHVTSSEITNDHTQTRVSNQKISGAKMRSDSQPLSHDEEEADDQDIKSVAITFLSLGGLVLIMFIVIVWLIW